MTAGGFRLHILLWLWLVLALALSTLELWPAVLPGYAELFLNSALFRFLC